MLGGKTVTASDRVKVETRTVGAFHAVAVSIPGSVELIQGGSEGLQIEADDNLLPVIETVVDNGELQIRLAKGVQIAGSSRIRVTVHAATVDSLSVAGSASLLATRLQTTRLEASIVGSGDVRYYGEGALQGTSVMGSGQIRALGGTPPAA